MNAEDRRKKIISALEAADMPISATTLANELDVSRQVIVGDIALMRASGANIDATPRGYVLSEHVEKEVYTIACTHTADNLLDELFTIVDNGCEVVDVVIEHQIYGQMTGLLHINSRFDAKQFLDKLKESADSPLSAITGGVHLHHLHCPSPEAFERVKEQLKSLNILFEQE